MLVLVFFLNKEFQMHKTSTNNNITLKEKSNEHY